jgi:hypothetical protein
VKVPLPSTGSLVRVTSPDRDACKADLLRCAESTDGWVDDLAEATREWAAALPMEGLLAGLHGCREATRPGRADPQRRTTARTVLLALACKDPDLLEDLALDLQAYVSGRSPVLDARLEHARSRAA